MENKLFSLQNKTNHQEQELAMLKNKSLSVDQNIKELKTLRNIKPLQELKTLQQEVRSISAQTSSLNMKEQARSQDVLALYNQVQEQGANSTRLTTNLDTKIKTLQKNFADIESKVDEATITENQTLIHLQQQIDKNMDLVAITAHPLSSTNKAGIIKFDDVKFSVGINNLSAYRSSGKFICENDGLYLISVSILTGTNSAYYQIYLNGNAISKTMITYNNQGTFIQHTGTVVLALQLHTNNSLWVNKSGNFNINTEMWSTLTIVKIK